MVSAKAWSVINVSLVLVAFILFLNFLEVELPTLGNALYQLDDDTAVCISTFDDQKSLLNVDLCCPELQQQLVKGERFNDDFEINGNIFKVNKKYHTGSSTINYYINQKAYRYCKNNGFLV